MNSRKGQPSPTSRDTIRNTVEAVVREEWGRVLATLMGFVHDFELAEDALQDAFEAALKTWPEKGAPAQSRAWLLKTARNKAIDRLRRDKNLESKRSEIKVLAELEAAAHIDEEDKSIPDERLRLIFTCCHPALAEDVRVALTLKTIAGLTTTEVARAFLVPETTMGQRIVRAKRKIKSANIPYQVPPPNQWPERLGSVLSVVYLIFNEGYEATSGQDLTRTDLCLEAIRLGKILANLAPGEPEVLGLLALMLLTNARRLARTDDEGNYVTLENQDRSLWNRDQVREGAALVRKALKAGRPGPYQIQAAISALHNEAESYGATDWRQITLLYGKLFEMQKSPVVRLNQAVALSFAEGPEAGLELLREIETGGILDSYQPYLAARADLLRRAGQVREAAIAYQKALAFTHNQPEKRFLEGRLQELEK